MKLSGVKYLIEQGVDNVWKNRMMAFASFCVLLVSLLMVGVSVLAYLNVTSIIGGVEQKNEVIVYLYDDADSTEIRKTGQAIESLSNVAEVVFYSREEAFADMKASMAENEVLFDSLGSDNPLPDTYRIKVADINSITATIHEMEQLEHVEAIRAPYDFVNFLTQLRSILTLVMGAIILAMIIVSMVIISNTTRTSVFARREEIQIMKYVGATDAFIRLPFFVEGMITGFFSGALALVITFLVYDSILDILQNQTYLLSIIGMGSVIQFSEIYLPVTLSYVLGGAIIGALGSAVSTRKYINV